MKIVHGTLKFHHSSFVIVTAIRLPTYRNTTKIISNIPIKLKKYLYKKHDKFRISKYYTNTLEFTFGIDSKSGISCMAVVHPKDQFSRKIGYAIVNGRILKLRTNPESCSNCKNKRDNCRPTKNANICWDYSRFIPDYMEVAGK